MLGLARRTGGASVARSLSRSAGLQCRYQSTQPSTQSPQDKPPFQPSASSPSSTSSASDAQPRRTVSFGFQNVPEEEKQNLVKNVFDSVASNYDLMNDATSFGVHRLWKDNFVDSLKPGRKGPMKCIDVAGGTGDIALRILDYAREKYADRETAVDVADINGEMLKEGYKRFKKTMYHNSEFLSGRAKRERLTHCCSSPGCVP